MNQDQLQEILHLHKKWLNNEEGGVRANLTNANLTNANLTDANLTNANLYNANLRYANLTDAQLAKLTQTLQVMFHNFSDG